MSLVQSPIDWHAVVPDQQTPLVADSRRRIATLLGCFLALASIILLRCIWINVDGGETYRSAALAPRQKEKVIPARRAAIVDRQGKTLAEDRLVDVLTVHYRWLQRPPDAEWLRREAKRSLSGAQQRNAKAIVAAEDRLKASMDELSGRLAADCGLTDEQWRNRCRNIQLRVERAAAAVNQRLKAKHDQATVLASSAGDVGGSRGIMLEAVEALFAPRHLCHRHA